MTRRLLLIGLLAGLLVGLTGCGDEKLPSRDQIPILQAKLYALEQGLVDRNRAAIDSLLSVEILDIDQSSDSLLRFVYGPDDAFPFVRLGEYRIFYGNRLAVINCYVMDSTEQLDRPLELLFKNDEERWLLKEFRVGEADTTGGT